jgi:lambda family phage portal protein
MLKNLIAKWLGPSRQIQSSPRSRPIRGRYDAAQTSDDNRRHWAWADSLSAASANSPGVRRTLRNRARYEVANNSYARGIVLTLANDTIGTGPRLQLSLPMAESPNDEATPKEVYRLRQSHRRKQRRLQAVEQAFHDWAREIDLAGKLRTMRMARAQDGEAFAILTSNSKLRSPISLDLRLVEAEQVTDPGFLSGVSGFANGNADGIKFDHEGNPTKYHVLREHPGGGTGMASGTQRGGWIPAKDVLHWFRVDRPGQVRGLPDIMAALPLFAQLRRFTLATIGAAETAADFAAVMYTDSAAIADPDDVDEMDVFELEQRMMTTLPRGWKLGQIASEHPATTYEMFKREIVNEIARCLNMPYNVAAANSSNYNYASGRLDHQVYFNAIGVDQNDCERIILDRIIAAWLDEAALIPGLIPQGLGMVAGWTVQWFWPGREHVDPAKEANAQATRLKSGTTHRAREYARAGADVETEDERAATSFGLTVDEYRSRLVEATFGGGAPTNADSQQQNEALDKADATEEADATQAS